MSNRYASQCLVCATTVQPHAGQFRRSGRSWGVVHHSCAPEVVLPASVQAEVDRINRAHGSTLTRFAGGAEVYRNKRGTCEDAPCCGCCS